MVNADRSGGHPQFQFHRYSYAGIQSNDVGTSGFGPLRWETARDVKARDGDDSHSIRIGLSHWIVIPLLLVLPILWLRQWRTSRRTIELGLCPTCGYDLRASPERCPECGELRASSAT